jgi:hypothetical protein
MKENAKWHLDALSAEIALFKEMSEYEKERSVIVTGHIIQFNSCLC